MSEKTSVALIGFMGVGKSTVAAQLAERLGKRLVATDTLIVKKSGKSIPEIFREDGEIAFREMEIEVVKELAGQPGLIIDCGGGVVLNRINIDRLREQAVIIWLTTTVEVILKRIKPAGDDRPLLHGKRTISDIKTLLDFRLPFYQRAADIVIDTSELDLNQVIEIILKKLKEDADFN